MGEPCVVPCTKDPHKTPTRVGRAPGGLVFDGLVGDLGLEKSTSPFLLMPPGVEESVAAKDSFWLSQPLSFPWALLEYLLNEWASVLSLPKAPIYQWALTCGCYQVRGSSCVLWVEWVVQSDL